jgi:hypothetical protein
MQLEIWKYSPVQSHASCVNTTLPDGTGITFFLNLASLVTTIMMKRYHIFMSIIASTTTKDESHTNL